MFSEQLHSTDWRERKQAVEAGTRSWNSTSLKVLLQMIEERHQDPGALNAALDLVRSRGFEVVEGLASLLSNPEPDPRIYAVLALGQTGSDRAIGALMSALDDPEMNVRQHAVEALGRLRASEAVRRLVPMLEAEFFLAFSALEALGNIGGPEALAGLLDYLRRSVDRPADPLAEEVVRSLGRLADPAAIEPICGFMAGHVREGRAAVVALLRIYEKSPEPEVKARILSALNLETFLEVCCKGRGSASQLALLAGWFLNQPQSSGLVPNQRERLQKVLLGMVDDLASARIAVEALAESGPEALPGLMEKLETTAPEGRASLILALGRIGKSEVVPLLLRQLESEEPEVMEAALRSLTELALETAAPGLAPYLEHASARVRQGAVGALAASLREPSALLQELLRSERPATREAATRVLGELSGPLTGQLLLAGTRDADEGVRRCAVESAALWASREDEGPVFARILELLDRDEAWRVRAAAARGLVFFPAELARAPLHRALRDSNAWTRLQACRSLEPTASTADLQPLLSLCHDPLPFVRAAAAGAIGRIGGPEAIRRLSELLADSESDVVEAASRALSELQTGPAR